MSSSIFITLVLVDDCVEMKIEFFRPIHQIVDYKSSLAWTVDVKHQVSDAVDDYQPDSRSVPNLMVNHADAVFDGILAQGEILYPLVDFLIALARQCGNALENTERMIGALLGIEVEDAVLVRRHVATIIQDCGIGHRRCRHRRHVKGLFALGLTD